MHALRNRPSNLNAYFGPAVLVLLVLAYLPLLVYWIDGWLTKSISLEHEYFSYALIGFPFAAYIAWLKRDRWQALPDSIHPLGLALLALGAVLYASGLSEFVNLSFPIVLAGLCLAWKGIPGLRLMVFPLLFVLLATPNEIPYLIAPYTLGLQSFIAAVAGFILTQFGVDVTVQGIYLYGTHGTVEVAPHCAGLKMLMTSLYVGLMILYWIGAIASPSKVFLVCGGAILLSVVWNIGRNTLLTLFHTTGKEALFHWLHAGWGGDVYSAGLLGMVLLWATAIDRLLPNPGEYDS